MTTREVARSKVRATGQEVTRSGQGFSIKSVLDGFTQWAGQSFTLKDRAPWSVMGYTPNASGETVTPERAMQLSAVWRAIRLTAETLATLPMCFYRDVNGAPVKVEGQSAAYNVCSVSPNAHQTPVEFWEQIVACTELLGNGFAKKTYIGDRLVSMDVLNPMRMTVIRNDLGQVTYRYVDYKGRVVLYTEDDIFHLKGFSLNGDAGISTVSMGAQTMGLALAADKSAGSLFKSGLRASGFMTTNDVFKEGDRERIEQNLQDYVGVNAAGSVMILEGGMQFVELSMSSQDAELLLTRKFQIEEIGRWFGMPPILLGHSDEGMTAWGTGVESIIDSWLSLGLAARARRIEAAVNKRVIGTGEAGVYARYDLDELIRVDAVGRAQLYSSLTQNGLRSRNELRAKDGLAPKPGGDDLTVQVNLVPIEQLGQNSAVNDATALKTAFRSFLGIEDQTSEK